MRQPYTASSQPEDWYSLAPNHGRGYVIQTALGLKFWAYFDLERLAFNPERWVVNVASFCCGALFMENSKKEKFCDECGMKSPEQEHLGWVSNEHDKLELAPFLANLATHAGRDPLEAVLYGSQLAQVIQEVFAVHQEEARRTKQEPAVRKTIEGVLP